MKYRFLAITATLIMLFSITVSASSYDFTISSNDNFISTQSDDTLTAVSEKLNTTPKELEAYLKENNIIYIAVSRNNKSQIKISALTDNFSSKVGDISRLDDAGIKEFTASISKNSNSPAKIVENGGRKYICVKDTLNDENGTYTVTQYITICNNKTYYFSANNPGDVTSDEITTLFNSFKLIETTSDKSANSENDWIYILINCGVVAFGVTAIILIVSIVITYVKAKKEPNCEDKTESGE